MPSSDRAFRALARARPDVLLALVRLALPELFPHGSVCPEAVDDPHLDLPPVLDADLIARLGDSELLHVEAQGYRDPGFEERLFQYHLRLVLRYRERRVRTVALWLRRPPAAAASNTVESSGVVIPVQSVELAALSASALLTNPLTVCFAPGADLRGRAVDEFCDLVAMALHAQNASWEEWCMAIAAAGTRGRKDAMIRAMRRANVPVIIEDLVDIGFDEGLEKGRLEGVEKGRLEGVEKGRLEGVEKGRLEGVEKGRLDMARETVFELLSARALEPVPAERARIESEPSLDVLKLWLRRAATCRSVAELLA